MCTTHEKGGREHALLHESSMMCVPISPSRSQRRAEQAEPAQVKRGKEQPLFCPWFEIEGQWKLPGCSQHHLQPPDCAPVCCRAERQPSTGNAKMLTVPPDPGCYFLGSIEPVVTQRLSDSLYLPQTLPSFFSFSAEREISCLSECCSSLPQVCGWEIN